MQLYLGHGDILPVPNIIINHYIPYIGDVPFTDFDAAIGKAYISNDNKVFIVKRQNIELIKNFHVLNLYDSYRDNDHRIYTNTSSICYFTMEYFMMIVPDIYEDNKAYKLSNDKNVYLVLNYTRHAFTNGNAFLRMFGDFDNVVVIDHTKYYQEFLLMPQGSDIG